MPDLYLPAMVQILEYYSFLQKTANALAENDFNAIGRIAKQSLPQHSSNYRSTLSNKCRIVHAAVTCMISCVNAEGQLYTFCHSVGHLEKMCYIKNRRRTAKFLTSKIIAADAQLGALGPDSW